MFTAASLVVTQAVIQLASLTGFDTADETAPPTCRGKHATIVGTAHSEILVGTPGRDVIVGLGGSDIIRGRGGDDLICGGSGTDRLSGGPGDDRLFGGLDGITSDHGETFRAGDTLAGGPGDDYLDPGMDTRPADDVSRDVLSWADSARGVTVDVAARRAAGEGTDRFAVRKVYILGSTHADVLRGSAGNDQLAGSSGRDRLLGRTGDDRLYTDPSDHGNSGARDVAWGGAGNDTIAAGGGNDRVYGQDGNDVISDFGNSADRLYGGRGRDTLFDEISAHSGDQVLSGGAGGTDELVLFGNQINPSGGPARGSWDMSSGRMRYSVGPVHAVASTSGLERLDLLTFTASWLISGTTGPDRVIANGSAGTRFYAYGGNDVFNGSSHDDLFAGGAGTDRAIAMGPGNDVCRSVEKFDMVGGGQDCESIN